MTQDHHVPEDDAPATAVTDTRDDPTAGGSPSKEVVAIILKKDTAEDLLNALIVALGNVPRGSRESPTITEGFEQAGDSTTNSDR